MTFLSFGAGIFIGIAHWLAFYKLFFKIIYCKDFKKMRCITIAIAFFRLFATILSGILFIKVIQLSATGVALGMLFGFNFGRFYLLYNRS